MKYWNLVIDFDVRDIFEDMKLAIITTATCRSAISSVVFIH